MVSYFFFKFCLNFLSIFSLFNLSDWGLRAIKSVLVLAGTAKRNNHVHNMSEEQLLLGKI